MMSFWLVIFWIRCWVLLLFIQNLIYNLSSLFFSFFFFYYLSINIFLLFLFFFFLIFSLFPIFSFFLFFSNQLLNFFLIHSYFFSNCINFSLFNLILNNLIDLNSRIFIEMWIINKWIELLSSRRKIWWSWYYFYITIEYTNKNIL